MATKSIGLSSRDFSTLSAWASYVNALTLSAPEVGEVYNDGGPVADTVQVTIGGYTGASGTNTVTLKAASGHGFRDSGTKASDPLRWNSAKGAALTNSTGYESVLGACHITGGYFIVDGLQFKSTGAGASICLRFNTNGAVLRNSILHSESGSAMKMSGANAVENAAFFSPSAIGVNSEGSGTTPYSSCTIFRLGSSGGIGFKSSYGSNPTIINTAVYGFTTDFSGTIHANSKNNATSLSSFGVSNAGTNGQTSIASSDFISVTATSEDLRPASSSTKLINTGATYGPASDIFGTSRPQGVSYDIGAAEYASGGGGASPVTKIMQLLMGA